MKATNQSAIANAILFVAPAGSYRLSAFARTAHQLQIKPVIVSTGHDAVITSTETGIRVDLDDIKKAVDKIIQALTGRAISSVIATDDSTVELASTVAQRLGLPHNSPVACQRARHKDLGRMCLAQNGLLTPKFRAIRLSDSIELTAEGISFPSVIKPLAMSASRGVMRVNNHKEFIAACGRIKRLLDKEGITPANCLVEDFIPGQEVAIEGFLRGGRFTPLALFDKPDALDGPYFEETYYIAPSRHSEKTQSSIIQTVQQACEAYELSEGPLHAECRINAKGIWIIELAARTIGGECSRLFEYALGQSLEEIVIRSSIGENITDTGIDEAAGVLMLPVTQGGVLRRVEGVRAAGQVKYIEQVIIDVRAGQELIPWPEGGVYPGFVFARALTPEKAETALRAAHAQLNFVVAPKLLVSIAA